MQLSGVTTVAGSREGAFGFNLGALAMRLIPALMLVYLGLENGGYDIGARSDVGLLIWWAVLTAAVVGVAPRIRGDRGATTTLLLLGAFAAWTALSLVWTESDGRTADEIGRAFTYTGFLVIAMALARSGPRAPRELLEGVTIGLGLIVALAVLSRLVPDLFPAQDAGTFLPGDELESRLAYPLNYSSGLAVMTAMLAPLLLWGASRRRLLAQAISAAMLPVAGLALWLTGSSLSIPLLVVGLLTYLALADDRLPKLGTLLLSGAGTAVLLAAASGLDAVDRGVATAAAERQGADLLLLVVIVAAGVGLAQVALGLAAHHAQRPPWLEITRRQAAVGLGAALLVIVCAAIATGLPGEASDSWQDFRSADGLDANEGGRSDQILDASSSGRYQFWQSAVDANASDPLLGIGPGTFEYWWDREGTLPISVRDAHSLYFEVLAELGIVGAVLIIAFVVAVLGFALRAVAAAAYERRSQAAAATAACAVFACGAALDWVWEMGVIALAFLLVAAAATARPQADELGEPESPLVWRKPGPALRVGAGLVAAVAIVAISIPLAGDDAVRASQAAATDGDQSKALADAERAVDRQPYAGTPALQEALVLERQGALGPAIAAAVDATENEPTNWRTWIVLSRLDAYAGRPDAAVEAYRHAKALNPRITEVTG